jgi:hypothetical protein
MPIVDLIVVVLLVSGAVCVFFSFTNEENISGMWVAGNVNRDKQYQDAGRFGRKAYIITRWAGVVLLVSGIALLLVTN